MYMSHEQWRWLIWVDWKGPRKLFWYGWVVWHRDVTPLWWGMMRDRKWTAKLMDCLGIVSMDEVVNCGLLRWYARAQRKDMSDWVSTSSRVCAGWQTNIGLVKEDAENRTRWRSLKSENRPTLPSTVMRVWSFTDGVLEMWNVMMMMMMICTTTNKCIYIDYRYSKVTFLCKYT